MQASPTRSRIAKLALNLLIAAFLLPVILYGLGRIFLPETNLEDTLFAVGSGAALLSLVCALFSWSVRSSKIIVIGVVVMIALLGIFTLIPSSIQ